MVIYCENMTKVYVDYIPHLTHFIGFHALVVIFAIVCSLDTFLCFWQVENILETIFFFSKKVNVIIHLIFGH